MTVREDGTKWCPRCETFKLAAEHFHRNNRKKVDGSIRGDGHGGYCKACALRHAPVLVDKRVRETRESLGIGKQICGRKLCPGCATWKSIDSDFYRSAKDGSAPKCKACTADALAKWRTDNPGLHKEVMKNLRIKNRPPEKHRLAEATRRALGERFPITEERWAALLVAFGNACCYCERSIPLEVEHLTPVTQNGTNAPDNIAPSCAPCNRRKWTRTAEEFAPDRAHEIRRKALLACEPMPLSEAAD